MIDSIKLGIKLNKTEEEVIEQIEQGLQTFGAKLIKNPKTGRYFSEFSTTSTGEQTKPLRLEVRGLEVSIFGSISEMAKGGGQLATMGAIIQSIDAICFYFDLPPRELLVHRIEITIDRQTSINISIGDIFQALKTTHRDWNARPDYRGNTIYIEPTKKTRNAIGRIYDKTKQLKQRYRADSDPQEPTTYVLRYELSLTGGSKEIGKELKEVLGLGKTLTAYDLLNPFTLLKLLIVCIDLFWQMIIETNPTDKTINAMKYEELTPTEIIAYRLYQIIQAQINDHTAIKNEVEAIIGSIEDKHKRKRIRDKYAEITETVEQLEEHTDKQIATAQTMRTHLSTAREEAEQEAQTTAQA